MRKGFFLCLTALVISYIPAMTMTRTVKLRVIETSDVHGCFFPYDFVNNRAQRGTLARVSTYVNELRKEYGDNLLLFDNGDILQGQPVCYYYNYIKTDEPNIAARVVNYMKYDAQAFGNHDVETGHAVYDKWIKEVNCPVLGANIIDTSSGKPYVKPYIILEREGVRIAVLGMLTPAIPNWLQESLWSGLRFENMLTCARYWMDYLKNNEEPDIIIGLFHSGKDGGIVTPDYEEDASYRIAKEVPGFDLILFGHDHQRHAEVVRNDRGKLVTILDPSCNALAVADAQITITLKESKSHIYNEKSAGRGVSKTISGKIVDITDQPEDEQFVNFFQKDIDQINKYVGKYIGRFEKSIYTRDCFFGNSAFTDFIHELQLKITGADISFNAPLSFDTSIRAGSLHVSDMFKLYRFENQIYVLNMTGEEIRNYLEMSYDLWVNTMSSPEDHIMLLNEDMKEDMQRYGFKNFTFNFDSAAGIDYEVDVTKPDGQKVRILQMSDGTPFDNQKVYKVAMNSYRGNGGGELLTRGAGIRKDELRKRIIYESEKDLRYYLMKEIEKAGVMKPQAGNNWRFVPEAWTAPAIARDRELLFGE